MIRISRDGVIIKAFRRLFFLKLIHLPTLYTYGITNRTEDNFFIPFFDYDRVEYKVVEEDINYFQSKRKLGTALVRVSKLNYRKEDTVVGSFHVIFFTKHTFDEVKKIVEESRCDERFKKGYKYQQRVWVLRISPKYSLDFKEVKTSPTFYKLYTAPTQLPASRAHLKFFSLLDQLPYSKILKYFTKLDNSRFVEYVRYVTR